MQKLRVSYFLYLLHFLCIWGLAGIALRPVSAGAGEPLTLFADASVVVGDSLEVIVLGGEEHRDMKLYVDQATGEPYESAPEYLSGGVQLSLPAAEEVGVRDVEAGITYLSWDTALFSPGTYYVQAATWGEYTAQVSPVYMVEVLPMVDVWTAVDVASNHFCGVLENGTVRCSSVGAAPLTPPQITDAWDVIAVGTRGACTVVGPDGQLACWQNGQQSIVTNMPSGNGWQTVDAYADHFCATNADGRAVCWGNRSNNRTAVPTGETWFAVMAGGAHSCGVTQDLRVRCWGYNAYGQAPTTVDAQWLNVAVGDWHTYFTDTREVRAVGQNNRGEVWGRKSRTYPMNTAIVTTDSVGCVLGYDDGLPICWGDVMRFRWDSDHPLEDESARPVLQSLSGGAGDMMCGLDLSGHVRCLGSETAWQVWGDALPTPFQN